MSGPLYTALPTVWCLCHCSALPVNSFPFITHLLCAMFWTLCWSVHISFCANSSSKYPLTLPASLLSLPLEQSSTFIFHLRGLCKKLTHPSHFLSLKSPSPVLKDWLSFSKALFFEEDSCAWHLIHRGGDHVTSLEFSVSRGRVQVTSKAKGHKCSCDFSPYLLEIFFGALRCHVRNPSTQGHPPSWRPTGSASVISSEEFNALLACLATRCQACGWAALYPSEQPTHQMPCTEIEWPPCMPWWIESPNRVYLWWQNHEL